MNNLIIFKILSVFLSKELCFNIPNLNVEEVRIYDTDEIIDHYFNHK